MVKKWERVTGKDLDVNRKLREEANKSVLKSEFFLEACKKCEIEPTKRQASKFNNKRGKVYKFKTNR